MNHNEDDTIKQPKMIKPRVLVVCVYCGKEDMVIPSFFKHRNIKTYHCSKKCYQEHCKKNLELRAHVYGKNNKSDKAPEGYKPVLKSLEEAIEIVEPIVRKQEEKKFNKKHKTKDQAD